MVSGATGAGIAQSWLDLNDALRRRQSLRCAGTLLPSSNAARHADLGRSARDSIGAHMQKMLRLLEDMEPSGPGDELEAAVIVRVERSSDYS
jgi:hypothetical protein